LALSADAKTLWVLDRFTGTVAQLDVSRASQKKAEWKTQLPLVDTLAQKTAAWAKCFFRRLGPHRDELRTPATSKATPAAFSSKKPNRCGSPFATVRGARETPPYFTPASTHSMGETSKVVGGRNRFHNPDPTADEIDALTLFNLLHRPTLPNPFVDADGAPTESLALPGRRQRQPTPGPRALRSKAGCALCHLAPHFTIDQDPPPAAVTSTSATPHLLPLREACRTALRRLRGAVSFGYVGHFPDAHHRAGGARSA